MEESLIATKARFFNFLSVLHPIFEIYLSCIAMTEFIVKNTVFWHKFFI
jgi:hypothetical protein